MPGNKGQLALGPGTMRIATLGSPEPADLITPWGPEWFETGYSKDGSKISYELDTGAVTAAEEIDPIHIAINGRNIKVSFVLMELGAKRLQTALNGGTVVNGDGIVTFEPHDPGEELWVMLGYESEDGTERWVFREGLQTGNVELERKKGNDNAVLAHEFQLVKPAPNIKPFKAILATPKRA